MGLQSTIITDMERYFIIDTKEMATYSVNDIKFTDPDEGGSVQYEGKEEFVKGIKEEFDELLDNLK